MFKPLFVRWLQPALRLALAALLAGPLALEIRPAVAGPIVTAGGFNIYLPLVLDKPCLPRGQVIFGCVEQNGVRVGGVQFTLLHQYMANPQPSTAVAIASSDAGGYFDFGNVPTVAYPDFYLATYENNTDPARLRYWGVQVSYWNGNAGQYNLGIVDLTNIPLFAPADGLHVTIPYTFTWGVRATSPDENYSLSIAGPGTGTPYAYFFQAAGHHGWSQVGSLPSGFQFGKEYWWNVIIYPSTYFGVYSYQSFRVTFDSTSRLEQTRSGWQTRFDGFAPRGANVR